MRALFTLLFGASLLLFIDRAEARGENGEQLQVRRLGWLALFGYLHFLLFWWGDILFTYALAGFAALAFRQARPAALIAAGLAMFGAWHIARRHQGRIAIPYGVAICAAGLLTLADKALPALRALPHG